MRFEERELKPYAEPVSAGELIEGSVYFSVGFVDDAMLIPQMETLVFIGKNLEEEPGDLYYFQDIRSYQASGRLDPKRSDGPATYFRCSVNELKGIYEFERLLEILMRCSLRRKGTT